MAKSSRFGNHARDDRASALEDGNVSIDVLANDRGGGGAKTIWSLDQADPSNPSTFAELPGGSTVGIGPDGKLLYKAVAKFDYLAEGEIAYDSFTYAMRLGNGQISVATVTVQITGVNDPAVLSKASVQVTEGDSADDISTSGRLEISDVDSPETFVAGSWQGLYGTLTLAEDGSWTYQADSAHDEFVDGKTYRDRFTVESADGTTTKVEIVILGTAEDGVETKSASAAAAIAGTDGADTLIGGAGAETLVGKGGRDLLDGGAGADLLFGGRGADTLRGGGGDDDLHGGDGNDVLRGESGRDRFFFDTALDARGNVDRIAGFVADDDSILLDRSVFAGLAGGALAPGAFRAGTAALDADDRIIHDAATGNLYYDPDGAGAAAQILFARLDPGVAVTHADFIVF